MRLTEAGLEDAADTSAVKLLISDGMVEEFGGHGAAPSRSKKTKVARSGSSKAAETEPVRLTAEGEALATRLRQWRTAEAKQLGVPAYLVLNDRTLTALAQARPANPKQLLEVCGMGPARWSALARPFWGCAPRRSEAVVRHRVAEQKHALNVSAVSFDRVQTYCGQNILRTGARRPTEKSSM